MALAALHAGVIACNDDVVGGSTEDLDCLHPGEERRQLIFAAATRETTFDDLIYACGDELIDDPYQDGKRGCSHRLRLIEVVHGEMVHQGLFECVAHQEGESEFGG